MTEDLFFTCETPRDLILAAEQRAYVARLPISTQYLGLDFGGEDSPLLRPGNYSLTSTPATESHRPLATAEVFVATAPAEADRLPAHERFPGAIRDLLTRGPVLEWAANFDSSEVQFDSAIKIITQAVRIATALAETHSDATLVRTDAAWHQKFWTRFCRANVLQQTSEVGGMDAMIETINAARRKRRKLGLDPNGCLVMTEGQLVLKTPDEPDVVLPRGKGQKTCVLMEFPVDGSVRPYSLVEQYHPMTQVQIDEVRCLLEHLQIPRMDD